MNLKHCLLGLAMLGASIGAVFAVDLTSAQAAYDKGDFEDAFKQFLSMAEQGNGLAQSSTGVMYDQPILGGYEQALQLSGSPRSPVCAPGRGRSRGVIARIRCRHCGGSSRRRG